MFSQNDTLFPVKAINALRDARGETWAELIDQLKSLSEDDARTLGFCLSMINLNGCIDCETDSYRAMRGCDQCSLQTLHRFKGTDEELLVKYRQSIADVQTFLSQRSLPPDSLT